MKCYGIMEKETLVIGRLKDGFRQAEVFKLDFKERGRFMISEKEGDLLSALMKNHKLSIIVKKMLSTHREYRV